MKHIKTYQIFESEKGLTPEQEEFLNKCTQGQWKWNSSTGEVYVEGDFDCRWMRLKDLKGIRFGRVSGNFICYNNRLEYLKGAPQEVRGDFYCPNNRLKSLKGAPQEVSGNFSCSNNLLESLEGAPQKVGGGFSCRNNLLESLEGAPQEVGGGFYCDNNGLKSLKGAPQKVGGDFYCDNNSLKSLKGAPQEVGGNFYSDAFFLRSGQWNLTGWMKVWRDGSPEAQNLIMPLLNPEVLNQEIQKDPQGMLQRLKEVWDAPEFAEVQKGLRFPPEFGDFDETIRSLQKLDSIKDFI
jgi:hypothetical protein